jgi:hypothetical protein
MFCPQCGTEYPKGVTKCAECGVDLVAELPDADVDLVAILVTSDPAQLSVAISLLEAEGIECETHGESGQEVLGLGPLPGATGPVRLLVAAEDEEAARALLAQQSGPTAADS